MKRFVVVMFFLLLISGCDLEEDVLNDVTVPLLEVPDTTAPTLTMLGDDLVTITVGETYEDAGAEALDADGDSHVIVSGLEDLDTTEPGLYYLYYNAVDSAGNIAMEQKRTIQVILPPPGVITSFTYESYDYIGVSVIVFDNNNVLEDLSLALYEGDTLIETIPVTSSEFSYVFEGLELNHHYELKTEGSYDPGPRMDSLAFSKSTITVGTYRTILESLREDIDNDPVFELLQDMVFLPFDPSMDVYSDEMITRLANVGETILQTLYDNNIKFILVQDSITSVPEYHALMGERIYDGSGDTVDDRPGIIGETSVARINYHGTSIDLLLQITGMLVNAYYSDVVFGEDLFFGLHLTDYWMNIYQSEATTMFPTSRYSLDGLDYFAESFAYYYFNANSRSDLETTAPQTFAFFRDFEILLSEMDSSEWWITP